MRMKLARLLPALATLGLIVVSACGGSNNPTTTTATVPSDLSISSFDANFTYMPKLSDLVKAGTGKLGILLPDTTTSGRYQAYDLPYLTKALQGAGYTSSQYTIDNAGGQAATELSQAQALITAGATVLIMDPLDSTTGSAIQAYAQSHGVKVISYDRATFTGTNTYYISFDNVQVGELIGKGFVQCVKDWGVSGAQVFELDGGQNSDPNAVSFAQGYNDAIWGDKTTPLTAGKKSSDGTLTLVGEQIAKDWDNAQGAAVFQQQYTAHPGINATVEANDGLGNAVIQVLKSKNTPAKKIPTTGQDATLDGMVNVLQGFQCGSVYKPIYLEAQDAVALATVLRAGQTPPSALLNSTTSPPSGVSGTQQPASLLVPVWVNTTNMNATVIKDNFVDKATLCSKAGAAACTAAGIS
jgi:D-xylose transport system substrate-binding protein